MGDYITNEPCPFCKSYRVRLIEHKTNGGIDLSGKKRKKIVRYAVHCKQCFASGPITYGYSDKRTKRRIKSDEAAIHAWDNWKLYKERDGI